MFSSILFVLFSTALVSVRATQCVCACNEVLQAPILVDDCDACLPTVCFANHVECQQAAAGGQQVKVEAKCIEVDPCDRAFEASLCVNDVNAKCIDATGRDPWEISCECAQLTANCLAEVNCPLDGVELETCAKTCTRDQCTATPGWRRNDIRPPGPAASATVNQLAGAALAVATALALAL